MDIKSLAVEGSYSHVLKIPSTWEFAPLHEVIELVGGSQPPKSDFKYEPEEGYVRLIQIRDYKSDDHLVYIPLNKARRFVSPEEVMIGRYGPPIFQILRGLEGAYNVALMKAAPVCDIFTNEYLFKYLSNQDLYNYVNSASDRTAGQSGVNKSHLEKYPVAVPPKAEQKVIADKLDTLLAQVETTKARLDRIPQILKTFRQSVLAAAVSGKLTEEWRLNNSPKTVNVKFIADEVFEKGWSQGNFGKKLDRAPELTSEELNIVVSHKDCWPMIRLGALCESIVPNRDKPKTFSGGNHWLLTQNFSEQSIWIDYSKIESGLSNNEIKQYNSKIIKSSNVIMTCVGRVGLSAVLEEDAVINQQLHAFIVNDYIKAEYLAYCIRANVKYYEAKATSTTISYLNKTSCNSLPIPLPTIEEQTEIVRRVEQLFAHADKIEQQVKAAQQRVNKLTQSILAKAFRGELTTQWRKDNPALITGDNSAEALLTKIKAEREAHAGKKKTAKKRKTKTV
jgi:type I restriction enzyme S subunit